MFYKREIKDLARSIEQGEWSFVSSVVEDAYNTTVTLKRGEQELIFNVTDEFAFLVNPTRAFTYKERKFIGKVYFNRQNNNARRQFFQKFYRGEGKWPKRNK